MNRLDSEEFYVAFKTKDDEELRKNLKLLFDVAEVTENIRRNMDLPEILDEKFSQITKLVQELDVAGKEFADYKRQAIAYFSSNEYFYNPR